MVELGTTAPPFHLPEPATGRMVSSDEFASAPAMLVMFICNHCPFVKHVREELARLGRDYRSRGVAIVAISSNDVANYPDDSPDKMKDEVAQAGYTFPYLFDETQDVARAYDAACTPDFFLFDRKHQLVYRGQLDDSRPGSAVPVTGKDLRRAIDAVLAGQSVDPNQMPSMGCNIKWKTEASGIRQ
jgi:peroxiredoxin